MYRKTKNAVTAVPCSVKLGVIVEAKVTEVYFCLFHFHYDATEILYLSGCGLANSSAKVDWSILLNPVCCATGCANKVL